MNEHKHFGISTTFQPFVHLKQAPGLRLRNYTYLRIHNLWAPNSYVIIKISGNLCIKSKQPIYFILISTLSYTTIHICQRHDIIMTPDSRRNLCGHRSIWRLYLKLKNNDLFIQNIKTHFFELLESYTGYLGATGVTLPPGYRLCSDRWNWLPHFGDLLLVTLALRFY